MNRARRELADRILDLLRNSPERAFKRREIAELCGPWDCQLTTAERRVKEALNLLISEGHPVLSDGKGFRLTDDPAFFEKSIHLLLEMRDAICVRIARLRRLQRRPRQPQLWEGVHAHGPQ